MKSYFALIVLVTFSHTVFSQWEPSSGPTGAQSAEIVVAGNYLFANGFYGGVFRSADKGLTWQFMSNGLPRSYAALAIDAEDTKVYIASANGIYYSADFGDTWVSIGDSDKKGFSIKASGDEIFVGYHNGLLNYSSDHGATWQSRQSDPFQNTIHHIEKLDGILWIGADVFGLRYSLDNGVNWITSTLELQVTNISSSEGALYVSGLTDNAHFFVYRSTDKGVTWEQILAEGNDSNTYTSGFFKRGNDIYISTSDRFCYSSDNGVTWNVHPLIPTSYYYPWTGVVVVDDDVVTSYGNGILVSTDKGASWLRRNVGYRNHVINNVIEVNEAIVTLSFMNGAFMSETSGDVWKPMPDPLQSDPYPSHIYGYDDAIIMVYHYNIYRSTDLGETWQNILTPDVNGLNMINGAHVAGFERSLVATAFKGVYFSRDMGDTWKFVPRTTFGSSNPLKSYIQHDTVIVLTQDEMFLSTNFGSTWNRKANPELPVQNVSINNILIDGSTLTMATGVGIYKSLDFGENWKKMSYFSYEVILDMKKIGDRSVICAYSGVYVSTEDGIGWYSVNEGLEQHVPSCILISDTYAFVGTRGNSVWRISITDLLNEGELIATMPGVRAPELTADCSTITASNAHNDVTVRWYKNGVLIPGESGSALQSTGPGNYTASFENEDDIRMSSPIRLKEGSKEDVVVYNVLTVNGDGKNDFYFVDEELVGSRLLVVDRWGDVVYLNNSYQNDWAAEGLSYGVYFYLLESKCFGKFKGVLTVMR